MENAVEKKERSASPEAGELRRHAEEHLRTNNTQPAETVPEGDVRALVHELQVHQIELEMQNEELRRAEATARELSDKYVTERKRLEAEAALRERQLKSFFQGATAGLALLDEHLRYVQINDTLAEMNGLPAKDHLGKTLREVVPWLAPMAEPIFQKVLASGEPVLNVELSGKTRSEPGIRAALDGVVLPDSRAGSERGRRRRTRRGNHRAQVRGGGAACGQAGCGRQPGEVRTDGRDDLRRRVARRARRAGPLRQHLYLAGCGRLLGLPAGTIGNSLEKFYSYVHPEELPALQEMLFSGMREHVQDVSAEYRLRKPDGTTLWVRSKGSAHVQADGHVVGLGTTCDITDASGRKRSFF